MTISVWICTRLSTSGSPATNAFGLSGREDDFVDILDDPDGNRPAQNGLEAAGLGLDCLEHVSVEAARSQVHEDTNARSRVDHRPRGVEYRPVDLVALPNSATIALLI